MIEVEIVSHNNRFSCDACGKHIEHMNMSQYRIAFTVGNNTTSMKICHPCRDELRIALQGEEVMRKYNRMKNALASIAWNRGAVSPEAMQMRFKALEGLE